jgi:hypothetical protein
MFLNENTVLSGILQGYPVSCVYISLAVVQREKRVKQHFFFNIKYKHVGAFDLRRNLGCGPLLEKGGTHDPILVPSKHRLRWSRFSHAKRKGLRLYDQVPRHVQLQQSDLDVPRQQQNRHNVLDEVGYCNYRGVVDQRAIYVDETIRAGLVDELREVCEHGLHRE